jgi:hypothetical protein
LCFCIKSSNIAFKTNRINMAMRMRKEDGTLFTTNLVGNFGTINVRFSGTKEKDFDLGPHKARYFLGIESDSPMICDSPKPSRYFDSQLFENCKWTQTQPVFFRNGTGGGPIFLNSKVNGSGIEITPDHCQGFAINLGSDLGGVEWPEPIVVFE